MREWRCFSSTDNFKFVLTRFPKFHEIDWEIRRDTFCEFEDDGFGLKERWTLGNGTYNPKLELKIRGMKDKFGIEYWVKCVEIPFTSEGIIHLNIPEIKRMLGSLSPSSAFCQNGLTGFVIFLENDFYRVNMAKERKKIQISKDITSPMIVEYVRGKVEGKYYFGVSVESENPEKIRNLVADLG